MKTSTRKSLKVFALVAASKVEFFANFLARRNSFIKHLSRTGWAARIEAARAEVVEAKKAEMVAAFDVWAAK